MGEVEQRAGGHHRVVGVTSGFDGGQKDGVYGLDLRQMWKQLLCFISAKLWTL